MKTLTLDEVRTYAPAAFATEADPYVTPRYQFLSTIDTIQPLLASGWLVSSARQCGKGPYSEHRISLVPPTVSLPCRAQVGDIRPLVHFLNAHDRSRAVDFSAGLYVCVCKNQLFIPTDEHVGGRWFGRHITGQLYPADLHHVLDSFIPIAQHVDAMHTTILERDQQTTLVRRCLLHVRNVPTESWISLREVADLRATLPSTSLWADWNSLQNTLIETGRRGRPITSIRRNAQLNSAFWQEAVAMLN